MAEKKKNMGSKSKGPRSSRDPVERAEVNAFDRFVAEKYDVRAGNSEPLGSSKHGKDFHAKIIEMAKEHADHMLGDSNPPRNFKGTAEAKEKFNKKYPRDKEL